jgi:hypothetical protein
MRSPEFVEALPELVRTGVVAPEKAVTPLRVARGELLSVRGELRAVLYLGVLLLVTGVSLLVKENLDRIGPATIAAAIGLAAAACLGWSLHRAPSFTWGRAESPDWTFDYLLLLGILLLGADLAYIEAKFTPLGPEWSWHLLLMSLVTGAFAVRCDSRLCWTLALSTFAAWRGVAAVQVGAEYLDGRSSTALRYNLILCGLVFVALGLAMRRADRKAHFEPTTTFLGALATLAGVGLFALDPTGPWVAWALVFLALSAALAGIALRFHRFGLFALGAVAAYLAFTRLVFEISVDPFFGCLYFAGSSVAMIVLLFLVQRRFRAVAREGHE